MICVALSGLFRRRAFSQGGRMGGRGGGCHRASGGGKRWPERGIDVFSKKRLTTHAASNYTAFISEPMLSSASTHEFGNSRRSDAPSLSERRNVGTSERRNVGTSERRNVGTSERRNVIFSGGRRRERKSSGNFLPGWGAYHGARGGLGSAGWQFLRSGRSFIRLGQGFVCHGQTFIWLGQRFVCSEQRLIRDGQSFIRGGQSCIRHAQRFIRRRQRSLPHGSTFIHAGQTLVCAGFSSLFAGQNSLRRPVRALSRAGISLSLRKN